MSSRRIPFSRSNVMSHVKEWDLLRVLRKIMELRVYVYRAKVDPWATRQALVTALALDSRAALDRGVSQEDLDYFDTLAQGYALEFVDTAIGRMRA